MLHRPESPTVDSIAATSELPPTSSHSGTTRCSPGSRSNIDSTGNSHCCNKRDVVEEKPLRIVPDATKMALSGTRTSTSTVSAVRILTPATASPGVDRSLHSAAGLFPFSVPTTIGQRTPFVVDGSTVSLSASAVQLGMSRWLPVPHAVAVARAQCPPLRLFSPIPADYFRERRGLQPPPIGYYVARPGDCRRGQSDFRFSVPSPAEVRDPFPPRSSSADRHRRPPASSSSPQVPVDVSSVAPSSDDLIAKLDPVSRAVYDNFLGKLRTTAKPKTGTGRRRHVTHVAARYRD